MSFYAGDNEGTADTQRDPDHIQDAQVNLRYLGQFKVPDMLCRKPFKNF
jgi:hypothetical protein